MVATEPRALIARLRAFLARGKSLRHAARRLGIGKSTAHKLARAHSLPRIDRRLTAEQLRTTKRYIREAILSQSEIARRVGVAKSTVHRLRQLYLDQAAGAEFRPQRLRTPRFCAGGHRVSVWPCVECNAINLQECHGQNQSEHRSAASA